MIYDLEDERRVWSVGPVLPRSPMNSPVRLRGWRFYAKNSDRQARRRGMVAVWAGAPENAVSGAAGCVCGTWRSGSLGQSRGGQPALGQEKLMAGSSIAGYGFGIADSETKPIPAGRDAAWGSGFPSHPSALPVDCAKQTQFRQRGKKRQVLGEKGVMVNCTFDGPWQNKAN
jgi:hypothetical protein